MAEAAGIEPTSSGLEPDILPLNYASIFLAKINLHLKNIDFSMNFDIHSYFS